MESTIQHSLRRGVAVIAVTVCSVALLLLFSAPRDLRAEGRIDPKQRTKLDVVLMFDTSGSMLKTDPLGLRYEGAKLLISFLADGDRLGIVQFAGEAKIIQELEAVSPSRKERAIQRISTIPIEGIFTDITEGIKVSSAMLAEGGATDAGRVIVVLSDGKVEPDPATGPAFARTLQLVQDMLPELKAKEMRVFTLALSEQADRALLGEVSAATDGLSWYAQTADELHKIFAEMFLALKRPQVLPHSGRGFLIDKDVQEATFYINHPPGATLTLVPPQGDVMTAAKHSDYVTWFTGQNFDVITVIKPELGDWRVTGSASDDGFATVLTGLQVQTEWPLVVRVGDEPRVQARLYEGSKPVALPEMNGVVKIEFQLAPTDKVSEPLLRDLLYDDGSHGDATAGDGVFSARLRPLDIGDYKLTIEAKGPTFQRSQQIPFMVRPRLISLSVTVPEEVFAREREAHVASSASSEGKQGEGVGLRATSYAGSEDAEFVVSISKEARYLKEIQLTLAALAEGQEVVNLPLKKLSGPLGRDYVATASALRNNGVYQVKAIMRARDKTGGLIEAESPTVSFAFTARAAAPTIEPTSQPAPAKPYGQAREFFDTYRVTLAVLFAISVLNIVGLILARRILKNRRGSRGGLGQRYAAPEQLVESLESLESRSKATAETIDDSVYTLVENVGKESAADTQQQAGSTEQTKVSAEPT